MRSPNNRGDRVPTGHLLSPNGASGIGTGLHSIELLAKWVPRKLQITQAIEVSKLFCTNGQQGPIDEDNTHVIH